MKTIELRQKTDIELKDMLADSQRKLATLRFDSIRKKVKNVREVRELRKNIARIHTLLREK